MKLWPRPLIYSILHILSGFIAYLYPNVFILIILYHLLQLHLGVRFFLFELTYREGNSIEHTAVKLLEVISGFLAAFVIFTLLRKGRVS
jgi:hypothetical protein